MSIHEGRWDCTYCGSTGILGRYTTCTSCGRSRPEGVKFYLPEEEPEVVNQKLINLADAGADWICRYCDSSNRAGHTSCQHCGSPREAEMPAQQVKTYEMGQAPQQGDNTAPADPAPAGSKAGPRRFGWPVVALSCLSLAGLIMLMLCGLMAVVSFKTYEVELTVKEVNWSRSIPIEAYRTVTEEDWAVPDGGRTLSTEQRTHHYNKVIDHYETKTREVCEQIQTGTESYTCGKTDLGNGFFKDKQCTRSVYRDKCHDETYKDPVYRDEPVYQTWYTYEIEKWVLDRTETASGADHQVYWPEYTLAENERTGERSESYTIEFIDQENQSYSETFTYDVWMTYNEAGKYIAQVDIFGEVMEIEAGQ